MSRGTNPVKLQEWTERLARFKKSNQTVSSFCAAEGVSTPSFYKWKQRLADTGRAKSRKRRQRALAPNRSVGFQSVLVTPLREGAASVKIQLPGGTLIELSNDMPIIDKVIGQLLQQQGTTGGNAC